LSALEQLAFKIPEKGYLHKVGIDMQGSMLQEICEPPLQVQEVGGLLQCFVSYIDKRFMKNHWMMRQQEGCEEAIDDATCVETVYDAGIKIEKSGIDWSRLQILREKTQDQATGEISVASSAPPTSAAGRPRMALEMFGGSGGGGGGGGGEGARLTARAAGSRSADDVLLKENEDVRLRRRRERQEWQGSRSAQPDIRVQSCVHMHAHACPQLLMHAHIPTNT
jgi:hypothetical protein